MREAFGWDLEKFLLFGAYPGAAPLAEDPERWRRYISDSLIETTLSRDILLLTRVDKPALLRRLFQLACAYSGQILAYQKMLGQLVDAGNTVTLAHYLQLLEGAGMVAGLQKFSGNQIRQRASSPKLQVLNTALMTAQSGRSPAAWRLDGDAWGRLIESAVGAHLFNTSIGTGIQVAYWRERNLEVDFVLQRGDALVAIEVKSGARKETLPGVAAFDKAHRPTAKLLVGGQGIPIAEFLQAPASHWLSAKS
jgi:predicted AAA+ superfamily ATPase